MNESQPSLGPEHSSTDQPQAPPPPRIMPPQAVPPLPPGEPAKALSEASIASLALGVASFIPILGILCGLVGICFGMVGMRSKARGAGLAGVGIVCAALGILCNIVLYLPIVVPGLRTPDAMDNL